MVSKSQVRLPRWLSLRGTPARIETDQDEPGVPRWSFGVLNDKATLEVPGEYTLLLPSVV